MPNAASSLMARIGALKEKELRALFVVVAALFVVFLAAPLVMLLGMSFVDEKGVATLANYAAVFSDPSFSLSVINSVKVAAAAAAVSVLFAFILAYTINCTNAFPLLKKALRLLAQLPMLLPTITYGFALIYSFGRQGLITQIFGHPLFDIYGFNGLLIGYVVYTLPTAFLLIDNAFQYIDKRFLLVSRLMGDSPAKTLFQAIVRPLAGTLCVAFILSFFLSFTDYGIPTSVGGTYDVVALQLFSMMLGSLPDFNQGAVMAVVMLVPSLLSVIVLAVVDRYSIAYDKVTPIEIPKSRVRDVACGLASVAIVGSVLSIFVVMFIVPFVDMWPFKMTFTLDHVVEALSDESMTQVFFNSVLVAVLTALFGCLIAYAAALVTARSSLGPACKRGIDSVASVVNTVPGMVLGVAYLSIFSGTPLQGTFAILVIANIVHYFATPYQMMKDSLSKMCASWEITGRLMGDSWFKTVLRVVTPSAAPTLFQVFGYYFVNAMVTISAVVFLTGAHTMVATTEISALQHVAEFDQIFVLSLLILAINLVMKGLMALASSRSTRALSGNSVRAFLTEKGRIARLAGCMAVIAVVSLAGLGVTALSNMTSAASDDDQAAAPTAGQVVIATNADQEALDAYREALDAKGFAGKYVIQSFGTSELGGRLLTEGKSIEADVVTMSSYYVDSAQVQKGMFSNLTDVASTPLDSTVPAYRAPCQALEGALFYNTTVLEQEGLPVPQSFKELADPMYEGMVSVPDIDGSSTGWLMVMAIVNSYDDVEAREILMGIYRNAGPYLSQSGSAPLKNVRAGEVAIGFGLRHQALADKADGLPIEVVDPAEGTYSLSESVAVVNKGEGTNPLAQQIAAVLVDEGRPLLQQTYPKALYVGEDSSGESVLARDSKVPLTVELLEKHQAFSDECVRAARS